MCGIAGIVHLDGQSADPGLLARMAQAIAHRGPDGEGIWYDREVGLAHRRLAIIDLQTGGQPMVREDLGRAVVFNGEIYNYVELRQELERCGQTFRTHSDTEILLVGHAVWGEDLLPKLRGMFAFALWEARARRLLLVRDPLGKKPLAVAHREGSLLAFASEAKALFEVQGIERRANPAALATYLDWMYVPEQVQVWQGIERLPPGSWLALQDGKVTRGCYWRPNIEEDTRYAGFEAACAETRARLDRATRIRLRSDVPLGIFLSGGVDSTLVALSAAAQASTKLHAFTVGFDGEFDERPYARRVADRIGAKHILLDVHLDVPALVTKVATFFDEPFGDSSAVPTLAMSWATKQHVKVVLSGDGGDEMFGGYDTYLRHLRAGVAGSAPGFAKKLAGFAMARARTLARRLPAGAAGLVARWARPFRSRIDSIADARASNPFIRQASMMRVAHWREPRDMLRPLLGDAMPLAVSFISRDCLQTPSPVRSAMLFDQQVYLPGDILKKVDIASMSTGLEVRAPILDDDVVGLSHAVPIEHHVFRQAGVIEERWRKRILKALCEQQMGAEFTYRRKSGFLLPLHDWLDRPEFSEMIAGGFASNNSPIQGWFGKGVPTDLWNDFRAGKRWLAQEVWNLIMLDAWARIHRPLL